MWLTRAGFFPPMSGGKHFFSFPPRPLRYGGKTKIFPPGGVKYGGKTPDQNTSKKGLAPQAKILVILNTEMRFPKGKSMIWGFDFSKFSLPPSWVGNPVEISKFFPPYGGKIPEVFPPRPSGVGGKIVRFFPPRPSDMGGKTCRFWRFPPTWGGKIHPCTELVRT